MTGTRETRNIKQLHKDLAHYQHLFAKYTSYCMKSKTGSKDYKNYKRLAFRYYDLQSAILRRLENLQHHRYRDTQRKLLLTAMGSISVSPLFLTYYMSARALFFYSRESAQGGTPPLTPRQPLVCHLLSPGPVCPGVPVPGVHYYHQLLSSRSDVDFAFESSQLSVYHVYRVFAPIRYTLLVHKLLPSGWALEHSFIRSGTAVPVIS